MDQPEYQAHFVPHPTYSGRQNAAFQQARRAAQVTKNRVQQANQITEQQNQQIAVALRHLTAVQLQSNPRRWWQWWEEYVDQHPEQRYDALRHHARLSQTLLPRPSSSLAKGTQVWTNVGRRAIETLKVGDLVLSQDPSTQRLAYKPVILVTRSVEPTRVIRLSNGDAFRCARGCAFWRTGHGWWQARDLDAQCQVRSLYKDQGVTDSAELIEGDVFDLEVADLGNFLIGNSGVLVRLARCI